MNYRREGWIPGSGQSCVAALAHGGPLNGVGKYNGYAPAACYEAKCRAVGTVARWRSSTSVVQQGNSGRLVSAKAWLS